MEEEVVEEELDWIVANDSSSSSLTTGLVVSVPFSICFSTIASSICSLVVSGVDVSFVEVMFLGTVPVAVGAAEDVEEEVMTALLGSAVVVTVFGLSFPAAAATAAGVDVVVAFVDRTTVGVLFAGVVEIGVGTAVGVAGLIFTAFAATFVHDGFDSTGVAADPEVVEFAAVDLDEEEGIETKGGKTVATAGVGAIVVEVAPAPDEFVFEFVDL